MRKRRIPNIWLDDRNVGCPGCGTILLSRVIIDDNRGQIKNIIGKQDICFVGCNAVTCPACNLLSVIQVSMTGSYFQKTGDLIAPVLKLYALPKTPEEGEEFTEEDLEGPFTEWQLHARHTEVEAFEF